MEESVKEQGPANLPSFQAQLEINKKRAVENLFPETEVLAQIGHSIIGKWEDWLPSKAAQKVNDKGFWPDGRRKFERTAEYLENSRAFFDQESAIMGGGLLAVEAAAYFYKTMRERGTPIKAVVISGGRPGYLSNVPEGVNEASAIQKAFNERINYNLENAEDQVIDTTGKNTKDDMRVLLQETHNRDLKNLTLVACEIRLPHCQAFLKEILEENLGFSQINVNFVPAEMLVAHEAELKGRSRAWQNFETQFKGSKPYKRTLGDEQAGYNAALQKRYQGKGQT